MPFSTSMNDVVPPRGTLNRILVFVNVALIVPPMPLAAATGRCNVNSAPLICALPKLSPVTKLGDCGLKGMLKIWLRVLR